MSRSYKKTPILKVCEPWRWQEKAWKRKSNRKTRKLIKSLLWNKADLESKNIYFSHKEIESVWCAPSDGKMYFGDGDKKFMRK